MTKNIEKMTAADIGENVKNITKQYKEIIGNYFNLLELWYRDVLIYKVCHNKEELLFQKEEKNIREQSFKLGYDRIGQILENIHRVRFWIKSNVNFELALEMLFIHIKDSFAFENRIYGGL